MIPVPERCAQVDGHWWVWLAEQPRPGELRRIKAMLVTTDPRPAHAERHVR